MTPIQSDNSEAKDQLRRWLKDLGVSELNAKEQGAIGQLLAEFQDLPSASISPRLERRLESLSKCQPTPGNPFKRLLALLSAGLATAGAVLLWHSSGLELQVAQRKPEQTVAAAKATNTPEPVSVKATVASKGFFLTSSQNAGAQAELTIRPEKATNLLVGQGLPQLPAGHTYRLWAETPFGLQGCVAFKPDAEGNATILVPREPSSSAISLLISIDPLYTGSTAEQPGKPVLTSI